MGEIPAFGPGWGGGIACLAVIGLFMAERTWVRVLCIIILALSAVLLVYQIMTEGWNHTLLIAPLIILGVGLVAHSVSHMFDPAKRESADDDDKDDSL